MVKRCRRFKLNAIHTRHHSPAAACKPRSENWRKPKMSSIMLSTGSTDIFASGRSPAKLGLEFICHLNFRTGIRWWWRGLLRKIRLPTGMMGCPSGGDVRLNVTCFHGRDVGGAEVPIVQGASLGFAQSQWDGVQVGMALA